MLSNLMQLAGLFGALAFGFLISPLVGFLVLSVIVYAIGDTLDGR